MTTVRAALAGAAQGLGAVSPEVGVLAAFGIVAAEPTLRLWEDRWREHVTTRTRALIDEAVSVSGLAEAELVDRLSSDATRLLLAAEILEAGVATPMNQKVLLLGRALARIAPDEALLDVERLTVRALKRLDAPHVHVLALLEHGKPLLRRPQQDEPMHMTGWSPLWVGAALPQYREAASALLGVLDSEGLVYNASIATFVSPTGPDSGRRYVITPFGRTVLSQLHTVSAPGTGWSAGDVIVNEESTTDPEPLVGGVG